MKKGFTAKKMIDIIESTGSEKINESKFSPGDIFVFSGTRNVGKVTKVDGDIIYFKPLYQDGSMGKEDSVKNSDYLRKKRSTDGLW
jgi:hypothetical protein